ncbi:hypothetical protein Ahy_B03g067068 isoform A [Arachis hypogaea]|uniref:KIB1-4 beta-propeller domain-containing protein n=1 Tax=Arachis hypogaea TaxID=3818 RepID=A0A445A5L1_ARAHY|nr:hypothetical protein Ahy_B03g067068 isoform A [Arachis hypogaea]
MGDDIDGWPNIHDDILKEIAEHLYSYDDFIQLGLVCKQWSLKLPEISSDILWLLVPEESSSTHIYEDEEIYHLMQLPIADEVPLDIQSLDEDEIHHLKLPEMQNKLIRGSFGGWLIVLDIYQGSMYMLNAFTKVHLDLPPISTFPDIIYYNPNNYGFEYTIRDLDFDDMNDYRGSSSFINSIYVLEECGQLYEFDINTKSGPVGGIHEAKPPSDAAVGPYYRLKYYLVGCANGSLLMLARYFLSGSCCTYKFNIYELKKNAKEWSRLDSLENYVLMIGFNSSVQMLPASIQTKGNQIYFTDNLIEWKSPDYAECQDIGIFDLDDGSCQRLLSDVKFMCPPVWCYSSSFL